MSRKRVCDTCGLEKSHTGFYSSSPTCKVCAKKQTPARSISAELKGKLAEHVVEKVSKSALEKIALQEAREALAEKRKVTAVQRELAHRLLSRRRLLPFIQRINPEYLPGWAHEHICGRLEQFERDIAEKKSPRLIICLPPRFGKSEIGSRSFPAWFMGLHPEWEVVSASHTASLALSFSRKVRETVRSEVFRSTFEGCHLDPESQALEQWMTTRGGSYTAVGVGGSLTGKGAHCLIIDDPVKDMADASSETVRSNIFDWYSSVARTRVAPGGGVLIIMTLWHDDDLVGRLTSAMGDGGEEFEVLKFAAINDGYDEYRNTEGRIVRVHQGDDVPPGAALMRAEGTAIHPDRYPTEEMLRLKRSLVSTGQARVWSALYQQNPVPDEGAYFEKSMFQYLSTTPDVRGCRIIQAWDFAITEKQSSDWTVGVTIAQTPEDELIVLDIRRFRSGDSFVIIDTILDYAVKWGAFVIGVEDGQIWRAMSALFAKRCRERKMYPNVHLNKPLTDKSVRASPLRGRMQMGSVKYPRDAAWLEVLQHEMLRFPAGKHDDCSSARTLVDSPNGPREMGELRDGDEILSYDGRDVVVKRVERHHCTGVKLLLELELEDGTCVELTPAHPVLTARGYVYAGDLTVEDAIVRKDVCTFYGMSSSGHESPAGTGSPQRLSAASAYGCTDTPGSRKSGQSPKGMRSTTRIETAATTLWRTLRASLGLNTMPNIPRSGVSEQVGTRSSSICAAQASCPQRLEPASTSGTGSSGRPSTASVRALRAVRSFASAVRTLIALSTAPPRAGRRPTTSTPNGSITAPCPASTAAATSSPAPTASGTRSSALSPAETSTATLNDTSAESAKAAATLCSFVRATPRGTVPHAAPPGGTSTSTPAPAVGERFYPETRMAAYSAIESVLTSTEDSRVTQRAMSDSARRFMKVVSIREIGFQPTYNFEVEGTRNFLIHHGLVVHNCVDALAWSVHTAMAFPATRGAISRNAKGWRDKLQALGIESHTVSHMTA